MKVRSQIAFHPTSLLVTAGFAVALTLALNAQSGRLNAVLAVAAVVAYVAIEALAWCGAALFSRARQHK